MAERTGVGVTAPLPRCLSRWALGAPI